MGIKYKENPHQDDFMKEVMDLLGDNNWQSNKNVFDWIYTILI